MKNQYVGDINDFAKYGLLRWLAASMLPKLRLGVIWYLTSNGQSHDGGRIHYLSGIRPDRYLSADSALFAQLNSIVQDGCRDTSEVGRRGVLPVDTVYYTRPISARDRTEWFSEAVDHVSDCDLVFLDPDNGLVEAHDERAPVSHATLEEVNVLREKGQSVVVIQFFHRRARHTDQIGAWMAQIIDQSRPDSPAPFALRWRAISSVGFLVIPSLRHATALGERLATLLESPWGALFDYTPTRSLSLATVELRRSDGSLPQSGSRRQTTRR